MWVMRQAGDLVRFVFGARTPADLHSPYLFDLFREVMNDDKHYYAFSDIEELRRALIELNPDIPMVEYGAGSRALHGDKSTRPLKQILNSAVSPPRKCRLIFRLVAYLQPRTVFEMGTSAGISTAYIAYACPSATVWGMDGNEYFLEWAQTVRDRLGLTNIHFQSGPFDQTLPDLLATTDQIDFVYLDGNHQFQPTLDYIQTIVPKLSTRGVLMLDDIRWSREMLDAWNALRSKPEFKACVDCYSYGLLFTNPDIQQKVDFRLLPSKTRPLGY